MIRKVDLNSKNSSSNIVSLKPRNTKSTAPSISKSSYNNLSYLAHKYLNTSNFKALNETKIYNNI